MATLEKFIMLSHLFGPQFVISSACENREKVSLLHFTVGFQYCENTTYSQMLFQSELFFLVMNVKLLLQYNCDIRYNIM